MKSREELIKGLVAEGSGGDFSATREGGLALIKPLNQISASWLSANVSAEASWRKGNLIVELRYLPQLVDAILDAGFTFERNFYTN